MTVGLGEWASASASESSLRFHKDRAKALDEATPRSASRLAESLSRFRKVEQRLQPGRLPMTRAPAQPYGLGDTFPVPGDPSFEPGGRMPRLGTPAFTPTPAPEMAPLPLIQPGYTRAGVRERLLPGLAGTGPDPVGWALEQAIKGIQHVEDPIAAVALQAVSRSGPLGGPAMGPAQQVREMPMERKPIGEDLVNPVSAWMGDEEEQRKVEEVLEEAGLPATMMAYFFTSPLNALPIVGFTKADDFVRLLKLASKSTGTARANIMARPAVQRTIAAIRRGGAEEAQALGSRVPGAGPEDVMRLTNDIPATAEIRAQLAKIDDELAKPKIKARSALLAERAKLQAQADIDDVLTSGLPVEEQFKALETELDGLRIELETRGLPFRGKWATRKFVPPEKEMPMGALSAEERAARPSAAQSRTAREARAEPRYPGLSTKELNARERAYDEFIKNAKFEEAPAEELVGRARFTPEGEVVREPTYATEGELAGIRAQQGELGIAAGERPVETAGPMFRQPEEVVGDVGVRPGEVSQPPTQPPAPPPPEPPRPPEPPLPEPGAAPDAAIRELIGGEAIKPQLGRFDRAMNAVKRTLGLGVEEEATASTLMRQRRELGHTVETLSNRVGAAGGRLVRQVFKTDKAGRIQTLPGKPTIQDVAARLPEYDNLLTTEQRGALDWLMEELAPYEAALREQGVEFGTRADIVEGGFYLPRGRADLEGVDMPLKGGGVGGKRGGRRGFERPAVFDRMTDGIDEGYRYAPFDEALGAYATDAGTRSLDAYTANLFKTATDEAGQLLGETAHARLLSQSPEIASKVEGLRKAVTSLKRNVGTLSRHHEEVLARFVASPGPDLEELQLALRELRESPMRSVRGQTIAEARASLKNADQQLAEVMPDWQKALEHSRQIPRGEGQIGFYQLQGVSYPDAVANAANKYLRVKGGGAEGAVGAVNNLLRGVRATADWSFTGIQGLLGLVHKPKSYGRAMVVAVRSVNDPDVLGRFVLEFDARAAREGGLSSREWLKQGLQMGGVETEFMIGRGAGRPGQLIAGAPVVKQANRAFGYFGDTLRLDAAQGMYLASGTQDARAIAEAANLMTGWSKGRFLGDVGNLVQFAPRFFQSQLDLMARALTDTGPAGSQARIAFLKLIGAGTLMTVAANEAIGNKGFDYLTPFKTINGERRLNPNFMRIRFRDTDFSLFGPWDSIVRGIVSAADGDFTYITRSKASPVVGMAWDAITGRTFMGEEYSVETFLRGLLPFSLAEIGKESALQTAIATTGVKATPMTAWENLATAWESERGKGNIPDIPFEDTAQALKAAEQNATLAPLVESFYASGAERGTEGAMRAGEAETHRANLEQGSGLVQAAQDIAAGLPGAEARYAEKFGSVSEQAIGLNEAIYGDLVREKGDSASQKALDAYYAIEETDPKYRDPGTGEVDRDAFFADKDAAFEALPQWLRTAMENDIKSVTPIVQQYEPDYQKARRARNEVYEEPKYPIPPEQEKILYGFMDFVRQEYERAKRDYPDQSPSLPEMALYIGKANNKMALGENAADVFRGKAPLNKGRLDLALEHKDILSRYFPEMLSRVLPVELERTELSETEFERVIAR